MKFAIFGNTYQAKKSSHAENIDKAEIATIAQLFILVILFILFCILEVYRNTYVI